MAKSRPNRIARPATPEERKRHAVIRQQIMKEFPPMMEYKGYVGRVEFDDEASVFHGEVVNTRDVITFQGIAVNELRKAFHESVDDYLAFCRERGEQPEKPCSGQFVTRISPDLHRRIGIAASCSGKSLNAWVTEQLEKGVQGSRAAPKTSRRR